MRFFVGLHQPADARHFDRACISINRLRGRKKPVPCASVLVDSGAFTEIATFGEYRHPVSIYAAELRRLHAAGVVQIEAAVAQDYMCEPIMLAKTGKTIEEHQRLTIERYDALAAEALPFTIMPVLQGFAPADYARHAADYGGRLAPGSWVGVGSVCKRNGDPGAIARVLLAILEIRPDLRLHGFGIKKTALGHPGVRDMLASADSMAWSSAARWLGGDRNSWSEAKAFERAVDAIVMSPATEWQLPLL